MPGCVFQNSSSYTSPLFTEDFFVQLFKSVASHVPDLKFSPDVQFSVSFVSPEKIQSLNMKYRQKDMATDVLSFAGIPDENDFGDLFLCPEYIFSTLADGASEQDQQGAIIERAVHGTLHLFGYDHLHEDGWEEEDGEKRGKEMSDITEHVLQQYSSLR